jgi:hypothetical protein
MPQLVPLVPSYLKGQCAAYKKNKKKTQFWHHTPLAIGCVFIVQIASMIALCGVKLASTANEGAVIGNDAAPTILFTLCCWTLYVSGGMFQYSTFKLALAGKLFSSSQEQTEALLNKVKVAQFATFGAINMLFFPLLADLALAPDVTVAPQTPAGGVRVDAKVAIFQVFFAGHTILLALTGVVAHYLVGQVTNMFGDLMKNAKGDQADKMALARDAILASQVRP